MRSLTYRKVSKGLKPLRFYIERETKSYRQYQHKLAKFVFWWNGHVINYDGKVAGSILNFKRHKVVCEDVFSDVDMCVVAVRVRPICSTSDIGEGKGVSKTIIF